MGWSRRFSKTSAFAHDSTSGAGRDCHRRLDVERTSLFSLQSLLSGFVLAVTLPVAAAAQVQMVDCRTPERPSVGAVAGRSSAYVELARGAVTTGQSESVLVGGGPVVTARGEAPIAGPLRLRVDGSAGRWDVIRRTYDPAAGYAVTSTQSIGHIDFREIGGAIGLRGGRTPVCAQVFAGGGLYSLTFRGTTLRRPGVALAAGIEFPTGARGRVQVDVKLHIIDIDNRPPFTGTQALAAALTAGWTWGF